VRRLLSWGVVGTLLFASPAASAFCRTMICRDGPCPNDEKGCPSAGKIVVWERPMPLTFRFQKRGTALLIDEEARAAVRAAFFRWTDVVCEGGRTSLRFVEGEDIVEDKPLTKGGREYAAVSPFGVFFRDTGWPHPSQNGDGTLALTTLGAGIDSGRITYADIEINTGSQPLTTVESGTGIDLQTVITHEVGHYIGLAHSDVKNALMNPDLCGNGDRCRVDKVAARRFGDDDRAAVCALFPPGASFAPPPAAADDSGCAAGPSPRSGCSVPMLAGLALLLVRRLRRVTSRR
jgi:hypothetical protein